MLVAWALSYKKDGLYSRKLIENALTMLERMNHRGGTGAEPDTGMVLVC